MTSYAKIETARRHAQRRADRAGRPMAVTFRDDLRNFEGGYMVEPAEDGNPAHAIVLRPQS